MDMLYVVVMWSDYLALLQAAYLQYERRIRPRGGMETRSFESRVEEAFRTPNLKVRRRLNTGGGQGCRHEPMRW